MTFQLIFQIPQWHRHSVSEQQSVGVSASWRLRRVLLQSSGGLPQQELCLFRHQSGKLTVCFWLSSFSRVVLDIAERLYLTSSLIGCCSSTGMEIVACLSTPAPAFETQCHSCMLLCGDLHQSVFLYRYVWPSVLQAEEALPLASFLTLLH